MKPKDRQSDNFVVTSGTASCHYDNLWCHQSYQTDDLLFSVNMHLCYIRVFYIYIHIQINGLVQECSNSIANAMELLQSGTKPSIYYIQFYFHLLNLLTRSPMLMVHVQDYSNSIANAMELQQSCTKPSIYIQFCFHLLDLQPRSPMLMVHRLRPWQTWSSHWDSIQNEHIKPTNHKYQQKWQFANATVVTVSWTHGWDILVRICFPHIFVIT